MNETNIQPLAKHLIRLKLFSAVVIDGLRFYHNFSSSFFLSFFIRQSRLLLRFPFPSIFILQRRFFFPFVRSFNSSKIWIFAICSIIFFLFSLALFCRTDNFVFVLNMQFMLSLPISHQSTASVSLDERQRWSMRQLFSSFFFWAFCGLSSDMHNFISINISFDRERERNFNTDAVKVIKLISIQSFACFDYLWNSFIILISLKIL